MSTIEFSRQNEGTARVKSYRALQDGRPVGFVDVVFRDPAAEVHVTATAPDVSEDDLRNAFDRFESNPYSALAYDDQLLLCAVVNWHKEGGVFVTLESLPYVRAPFAEAAIDAALEATDELTPDAAERLPRIREQLCR